MDTSVVITKEVAPDADAVMSEYQAAYEVIHASFKEFMRPIAHLMPPKKEV